MASDSGLRINPTKAFARDLKRVGKRGWNLARLQVVLETLRTRQPLTARHRDHPLKGEWKGWRDCHVEPDWVLVDQVDEEKGELILGRTGSHADLFE